MGASTGTQAAETQARPQEVRSVIDRRVTLGEVSTCFPLGTDRGMPCLHPTSVMRFAFVYAAWSLVLVAVRVTGLREEIDAAERWARGGPGDLGELPLWTLAAALAAAWVALPMLLVHCSQFGASPAACLSRPNYCLAVTTAPFLLWAGCSCCGSFNDAVEVYHGVRIPKQP